MKTVIYILLFFIIKTQLYAQSTDVINLQYVDRYKENSEFSYTSPYSEIGAPSKYIISGKLTTTYMLLGTKNSPVAFAVIPEFTVRVRNEKSAGVRTPSFKLGGSTYIRLNKTPEQYKYAELGFTHYSNGQDADAINTDGSINTYNGNFSTNYLTASYRFGNFSTHNEGENYNSYHNRFGLQWNKWFSYEKALEDNYGFTRLLYNFSFRKYGFLPIKNKTGIKNSSSELEKEYFRFNTDFSYAINRLSNSKLLAVKKRLNLEMTAHYSLPFMQNVFLMASVGYYGEDPYNIYFLDHYAFMRFGISTGFIRYRINP